MNEPEFLTTAELQTLLSMLPQRERVMVLLDATTGLRRGELIGLRWQDIDFDNNIANISAVPGRPDRGNTHQLRPRQ